MTDKKTPTVKKVVKKTTPAAKKVTKKATKVNINQTKKLNKTIKQVQMGTPVAFKKIASKRQNIKAGGTKSYLAAKNGAFYTGMNMSLKGSNMVWVGNSLVSKYEKKGCTTARYVSLDPAVTPDSGMLDGLYRAWEYLYGFIRDYGALGILGVAGLGLIAINNRRIQIDEELERTTSTGTAQPPTKSKPNSAYYQTDANGNKISTTVYDENGNQMRTLYESRAAESEGASEGEGKSKSKGDIDDLGDADINDLDKLPQDVIDENGGENIGIKMAIFILYLKREVHRNG